MVYAGCHVGELHEVLEVFDSGVAAAFVEVMHKGRAVSGHKHRALAADSHTARRVASVLHVLTGCGCLDDLPAHAGGEANPGAIDVRAGFLEQLEDFGVVKEIDANFCQ